MKHAYDMKHADDRDGRGRADYRQAHDHAGSPAAPGLDHQGLCHGGRQAAYAALLTGAFPIRWP